MSQQRTTLTLPARRTIEVSPLALIFGKPDRRKLRNTLIAIAFGSIPLIRPFPKLPR